MLAADVPEARSGVAWSHDLIPNVVIIEEPSDRSPRSPHGNAAMDPLTIILISLTTLVAANLAAVRSKG